MVRTMTASRLIAFGIIALLSIRCGGDSLPEPKQSSDGHVAATAPAVAPFKQVAEPIGTIHALAFSVDGRQLFSGVGPFMPGVQVYPIRAWDVYSMAEVSQFKGHKDSVACLDVTPHSPVLASVSHDNTVRVWDLAQNREMTRLRLFTMYDTACVTCLQFSPTGNTLVLGGGDGDGRSLTVWDWKKAQVVQRYPVEGQIGCLSVTKDGQHVVVGGWHGSPASRQPLLALLDLNTGQALRHFESNPGGISAVALSSSNELLLAGSGRRGVVDCYDLRDGRRLQSLEGHQKSVAGISFLGSEDEAITAGSDGRIMCWDVKNGRERWSLETGKRISAMAVSPLKDLVAVGAINGWIALWKLSDLDEKLARRQPATRAVEVESTGSKPMQK